MKTNLWYRIFAVAILVGLLVGGGIAADTQVAQAWTAPVVTPLCAPDSTHFAFEVMLYGNEPNYDYEWSYDNFQTYVKVAGQKGANQLTTERLGQQIKVRWASDRRSVGQATANGTLCEQPPFCQIDRHIVSISLAGVEVQVDGHGGPGNTWRLTKSLPFTVVQSGPIIANQTFSYTHVAAWDTTYTVGIETKPGSWYSQPGCTYRFPKVPATLTLVKTVVNEHGGTATVESFTPYINEAPVSWNTPYSLNAGVYTATESTKVGYNASAWSGDCAADGSIVLLPGDNKTCTIVNSDMPATLTLVKTVVNEHGGTATVESFTPYINEAPVSWNTPYSLNAGVYTATESTKVGYNASAWSGDCAADGSIVLLPGDNKTCTIVNSDMPATLTLVKTVVNEHGGTATVESFTPYINEAPVSWNTPYSLNAGVYTATESTKVGYNASAWSGDCAADGSIVLLPGDNKTCTIVNSDMPPTVVLTKTPTEQNVAVGAEFEEWVVLTNNGESDVMVSQLVLTYTTGMTVTQLQGPFLLAPPVVWPPKNEGVAAASANGFVWGDGVITITLDTPITLSKGSVMEYLLTGKLLEAAAQVNTICAPGVTDMGGNKVVVNCAEAVIRPVPTALPEGPEPDMPTSTLLFLPTVRR